MKLDHPRKTPPIGDEKPDLSEQLKQTNAEFLLLLMREYQLAHPDRPADQT